MNPDVLFVNPGNPEAIYQGLSKDYAAIEPPTWALLLAESVRAIGYNPAILDVNAERLTTTIVAERVKSLNPRLVCLVVYGQNPNSGTVNMEGAIEIANSLKFEEIHAPICIVGSHASALPLEILKTELAVDIVLCNEGVYALHNLLASDPINVHSIRNIRGIGYREDGIPILTEPEIIVPQSRLDIDLPGYAWDLLPYRHSPLDLYRSHFWHAYYDHKRRTPFAAIYTSLGCTFRCEFCMINILNRDDTQEVGIASNYAKMRFWSPQLVIKQIEQLLDLGVRTLRISDEMFLLNRKYYEPLCLELVNKGYGELLNMWAYSRVDTIRNRDNLRLIRDAGIRWLALGIESGDKKIRREVTKGAFEDVDIRQVIQSIEDAGIDVIANYIFGLPGDNIQSMKQTLELSKELCTLAWNGYPAMALPGSAMHANARKEGWPLPDSYIGYSFHGYDTLPIPTRTMSSAEVLRFRDSAFNSYHSNPRFLDKIQKKFGSDTVSNIKKMVMIQLPRKLLELQE